ncbi:hypothetical protein BCR35DRAFT_91190 [Leucosporidium creatinivorum]|uniref:Glucose receptor Git3-like N-terminal domain-containing protein n=1 Tax=Leucosporidium creatinivorum TaxID=106004 RepID=A0A1Y2F8G3_9BASI|nr:hypothetical protein BCR35DRAFT_91190 [Leucosporidium creatinivorum]
MSSTSAVTVNLVITSLSFLGGSGIVVGYFRGAAGGQRLRQRLVLGLGICDMIQALDVLIGSSLHLSGRRFPTNSPGCNAIGFIYQTCVVVSAAWTLTIAVITYSTLVRPMSRLTMAIESPRAFYWIWAIVWSLGLIPAIFGTIFFAMVDVGGICWYQNGSIQSKIMIFIPRAIALLGVIGLYSSLFIFFRRRDMSLLATTSNGTQDEEQSPGDRRLSLANVSQKLTNWGRRTSSTQQATIRTNHTYNSAHDSPTSPNILSPPLSPIPQSPRPDLLSRPSQSVIITLPPSRSQRGEESDSAASTGEFPEIASFSGPPPTSKTVTPKRGSVPGTEEQVQLATYRNGGGVAAAPIPTVKRLSPRQVNKRLSLLMMLYPLAYLLLFSVSVGRLIATLITSAPTHPVLTNISRWLVFGQGLVDGILYFVIEYLFRRSTRGRT